MCPYNAVSRLFAVVDNESQWLYDEQEKCCETVSGTLSVKRLMSNMYESADLPTHFDNHTAL